MPLGQIALLGAIAGLTIFLGLPLARWRTPVPRMKALLSAVATGILVFLFWDVLTHAWEPIDQALGHHELGRAAGNGGVLFVTLGLGLLGLVYLERRSPRLPHDRAQGPGAVTVGELRTSELGAGWRSRPGRLALTIAVGIGLHNFAEGLAIGNSAAQGELALAMLLIIGFGLHNATEGFGIIAPLTGTRPSWGYLAVLGLIGGGPTFVGTLVGRIAVNDTLSIAFLGLAAGSILYVVLELLAVTRKTGFKTVTSWGVFTGIILGFTTDAIVTLGGA